MNDKLDQEQFKQWLFKQPLDRIIEAGSDTDCFLCSFVKETSGYIPLMTYKTWWIEGNEYYRVPSKPLPQWAIELIDFNWCKSTSGYKANSPITAAQMQNRYLELFPSDQDSILAEEQCAQVEK